MDSAVKEVRLQKEGEKARRASLMEVEGTMSGRVHAKALKEDLPNLGFIQVWSNLK